MEKKIESFSEVIEAITNQMEILEIIATLVTQDFSDH